MNQRALVGIFVGGSGRRMGGVAKGLLRVSESETLIERQVRLVRSVGAPVCLVGADNAYAALSLPLLKDTPAGVGPLGGLLSLFAAAHSGGFDTAVSLACDMPYFTPALLERLLSYRLDAQAVAPRTEDKWQPLFARYEVKACTRLAETLLKGGAMGLYRVLDGLGTRAVELPLSAAETALLKDWDTPEDLKEIPG